jgi:hypothetical protein
MANSPGVTQCSAHGYQNLILELYLPGLRRKPFTAFGAASVNNGSAIFRGHAGTEAVRAFTV